MNDLSSSTIGFVAGKHRGGGGSFFDRDKQFMSMEKVSSTVVNHLVVLLVLWWQKENLVMSKERKEI